MKSLEAKIAEMQAGALQVFRTEPTSQLRGRARSNESLCGSACRNKLGSL